MWSVCEDNETKEEEKNNGHSSNKNEAFSQRNDDAKQTITRCNGPKMTIAASDESQDPMFRPRWHQSTTHFKLIRLGCVAILIAKLIASAQQWHTHTHKWSTLKWSAFAEEADSFFSNREMQTSSWNWSLFLCWNFYDCYDKLVHFSHFSHTQSQCTEAYTYLS